MLGELRPVDGGIPILLEKPSITVGQDRICDVVIEHPTVSASHCHMELLEGHWFIEDLGSRGGVSVNGEKVDRAWLPALSVISIGAIEFDFRYSANGSAANGRDAVSPVMLTKLDRALKFAESPKHRRTQVRADQPAPAWVPKTKFGMLVPLEGEQSIPLLYEELYLGRDHECDVILPYLSVANTHCVLRFKDGFWTVRDLHHNGVTIDGVATQEGRLPPGAILGVATHRYVVDYSTTVSGPSSESTDPTVDGGVLAENTSGNADDVVHIAEFDEVEVDESALIDDDDERHRSEDASLDLDKQLAGFRATSSQREDEVPVSANSAIKPRLQLIDEPQSVFDDMLRSLEATLPPMEDQPPPVAPPLSIETPIAERNSIETQVSETKSVASSSKDKKATPAQKRRTRGRKKAVATTTEASQPEATPSKPLLVTKQQISVVQQKHDDIVQFLKNRGFDGLLLSRPASIAWYTGGVEVPRGLIGQSAAALLITPEGGTLLARKADHDWMLRQLSSDVVLQHRECAWPGDSSDLLADWKGTKKLACDQSFEHCSDVSSEIAAFRLPLRPGEIESLRKLGIRVARTVERAAREFQRGDTEAQIAGDVASRLIRHEVAPVQIQVWGDGGASNCDNWKYGREFVNHNCTISVIAQRQGLHVGVSRTISFGIPSKELRWTFPDMLLAHATALAGSRDQVEIPKVWGDVQHVCETLGEAEEWRATDPGCVTGYELCEAPISAMSTLRLRAGVPVIWRSSIGPARAVDTVLVREADNKIITQTGEWPLIGMKVNNQELFVQTVLQRAV